MRNFARIAEPVFPNAMKRLVLSGGLLFCVLLCMAPECGFANGDKAVGVPCTRSPECMVGLSCIMGMCQTALDDGGVSHDAAGGGGHDASLDALGEAGSLP